MAGCVAVAGIDSSHLQPTDPTNRLPLPSFGVRGEKSIDRKHCVAAEVPAHTIAYTDETLMTQTLGNTEGTRLETRRTAKSIKHGNKNTPPSRVVIGRAQRATALSSSRPYPISRPTVPAYIHTYTFLALPCQRGSNVSRYQPITRKANVKKYRTALPRIGLVADHVKRRAISDVQVVAQEALPPFRANRTLSYDVQQLVSSNGQWLHAIGVVNPQYVLHAHPRTLARATTRLRRHPAFIVS